MLRKMTRGESDPVWDRGEKTAENVHCEGERDETWRVSSLEVLKHKMALQ